MPVRDDSVSADPLDHVEAEAAEGPLWQEDAEDGGEDVDTQDGGEAAGGAAEGSSFSGETVLLAQDESVDELADAAEPAGETVLLTQDEPEDEPVDELADEPASPGETVLLDHVADEGEDGPVGQAEPEGQEAAAEVVPYGDDEDEAELATGDEALPREDDDAGYDDDGEAADEALQEGSESADEQGQGADGDADEPEEVDEGDADKPRRTPQDEGQPPALPVIRTPLRDPLQTIDVGMDDGWYEHTTRPSDRWDGLQRPYSHRRDRREERTSPYLSIIAGLAAVALVLGFVTVLMNLAHRGSEPAADEQMPTASKRVSKDEANQIIASLNGWWKTGRTLDGRTWHLQDGLMETYAADGKLAAQVLLDPASVERMEEGPGGIEGAGYYLRDVGYYLRDDDGDTLHAIDQDGSADADANLLRSEAPSFVSEGAKEPSEPAEPDESDTSEYLLPESATRVYETSELEAMSDHDLFVARNEIYARHGYVFETGELSTYFSSKSWYHPSDVFNEGEISDIERQNVSNILAIEQARGSRYV